MAKRISGKALSYKSALSLIVEVSKNHDNYWKDNVLQSRPEKQKYVRSAFGTPLGELLSLIDTRVLKPYDNQIPDFIYGGLSERNHIEAAFELLGTKKDRRLLSLDISRFFEQITEERVFYFFYKKADCTKDVAMLLSNLCCVQEGPKGSGQGRRVLGRGFASSPRLSIWCNLDTFLRVYWLAKKRLKNHDARVCIFVDDIGISASKVSEARMDIVLEGVKDILLSFDKNQPLPINHRKTKNKAFSEGVEHLGLHLGRNKLTLGAKTRSRKDRTNVALKAVSTGIEKKRLLLRRKAYFVYKKRIASAR